MAVTFAARRGVARAVGRMWERVPEWPPRGILPSQLPLPPLAAAPQRPALPLLHLLRRRLRRPPPCCSLRVEPLYSPLLRRHRRACTALFLSSLGRG